MTLIKSNLRRILFYALGVFVLALGVSISIRSNLGVSPNSSVPYTFSLITGLDNGLCQALIFTLLVLIQRLVLGRDFKPIQWLQVLTSVLFGFFVTVTTTLANLLPRFDALPGRIGLSLLGSFLVGTGIFLYLAADLVPMSAEGLVQAAAAKTGKSLPNCKLVIDCIMVMISAAGGAIFLGSPWRGIGLGTVLAALLCSRVLALHLRLYGPRYRNFLHRKSAGVPAPEAAPAEADFTA